MAKQKKESGIDYGKELSRLKEQGAKNLYLLWGAEDYLRERFLEELKSVCLSEEDDFNYKRINGPKIDLRDMEEAVNSMPFMSERCLVEVRDFDLNACKKDEQKQLLEIIDDIPDYCTLVFVEDSSYQPDGRLTIIKAIKKSGEALEFAAQEQSAIIRWIGRRFKDYGKDISRQDAEYLVFTSGGLMNQLIPEIEKLSNYTEDAVITRADIDAVAIKLPEANVFAMTDNLIDGNYDAAIKKLSELLRSKEKPIGLIAIISNQIRQLYAAKLVSLSGRGGGAQLSALCEIKQGFVVDKLMNSARRLELSWLSFACEVCVQYDYKMKSSSTDDEELLKELFARLAIGA